ncbi:archease [Maribacter aestuarii]|uniref:archease n=1 Tax=Maribacter aestuarii TaxID=1130723 RepID=UPI00248C616A|nr:archease [Maribacter aestuarii]
MKIEYLPHTADIRMKIEGSHLEELFRAGVKGMSHILKAGFCDRNVGFDCKLVLEITALDSTCLLIDFLSEALSTSYAENAIFCEVEFLDFTPHHTIAEIRGKKIQGFDEEIKAVTYHEADVCKNNRDQWATLVIFDI